MGILVYWIYFAILEAGIHQATLGKRALKIYVTDNIGSKIRLSTSFLRSFLKLLLTITPFSILTLINGLSVSDSAQGKGLHDYLSNTLVLTNQTTKKPFIFGNIPSKRGLGYFLAIALVIIILIVISAVFGAIIFGMVGSQQTSQQISKTGDVATIAYTIYDDQNRPIVTTNSKIYNDTLNNGGTIFYSNPLMIPVNVATNTNVTRIPVQYQQYQTYFGLFKDEMGLISTGLSGMKMNDQKQISLVMTKDPLETTIDADQFAHLVKPVTETHVNEQIVLALTDQPQQVNLDNTASADQYMRTFYVKKINPEGLDMKYGYSTIDLQILSIKTK